MNYDIASELSGLYNLSSTIPALTTFFIAASGILLLCFAIGLVFVTKRKLGMRLFPVLYGFTAYLLFYIFIGGFLTNIVSLMAGEEISAANLVILRLITLIISTAALVGGRFFAMWFIRKYYSDYCDAYGIGIGVSLTEAIMTLITIFLNYCLCLTINSIGLVELTNSYESVEEAAEQLAYIWIFFENPSYTYLLSGFESIMFLIFNTMISVLFYGVYHGELKKLHLLTITALQTLIYFPGKFYSAGLLFNRIGCFITELVIFVGSILFFIRLHNTFYHDITPPVTSGNNHRGRSGSSTRNSAQKKMPDFNKNINKM